MGVDIIIFALSREYEWDDDEERILYEQMRSKMKGKIVV